MGLAHIFNNRGAPGAGGGEPKGKRARPATASVRKLKRKGGGSSAPALAAAPASRVGHPESAAASVEGVTVEDADALDCGVCFLPLKAPILQCDVGHVVCSPCSDKLKATGKCHVCGVATGAYRRCYDMERLVDSIRVQCPYATYGCAERPAYHDRENHRLMCTHVPCYCPSEACTFVGSTEALLDHFSAAHSWPCISNAETNIFGVFTVRLHDGFNILLADADCSTGNKKQGVTASVKCLLLLTVAREPHARIISVHWINPRPAVASSSLGPNSSEMQCKLSYSPYLFANNQSVGNQLINHSQTSTFRVACTDLSNGLPKPDDCFQFVVPNSVIGDHDKDSIMVGVRIIKPAQRTNEQPSSSRPNRRPIPPRQRRRAAYPPGCPHTRGAPGSSSTPPSIPNPRWSVVAGRLGACGGQGASAKAAEQHAGGQRAARRRPPGSRIARAASTRRLGPARSGGQGAAWLPAASGAAAATGQGLKHEEEDLGVLLI